MASKRMFSENVIETEDFLGLSAEAQALYLHLNMRADDDGFLNNLTRLISYYETDAEHIDELEMEIDDEIWPLPKYRELLFTK